MGVIATSSRTASSRIVARGFLSCGVSCGSSSRWCCSPLLAPVDERVAAEQPSVMGLLPLPEAGPDVPAVDPRAQTVAVAMKGPASPELEAIPCGPCAQDLLASNQLEVVIGRAPGGEPVELGRGGDALSRDGVDQPACRG